jgi:hypothetical protein
MNIQQAEILRTLLRHLDKVQRYMDKIQKTIIKLLDTDESQSPISPPVIDVEELPEEPDLAVLQSKQTATPCINLVEWLKERNITLLRTVSSGELDETLDRLATILGRRFQNLRPFYQAIKRRMSGQPSPHAIRLAKATPRVISDICQFAIDLNRNGFLRCYHYNREQHVLSFDPQMDSRVINFFTGGWLERYVLLTALEQIRAILSDNTEPTKLTKAVLKLPDGQETELDILLGLPDRVIWIECKTGDWQEYIARFGRVARCLRIPSSQAALVLLDALTPEQKKSGTVLSHMTVINPEDLEGFVESALLQPTPEDKA